MQTTMSLRVSRPAVAVRGERRLGAHARSPWPDNLLGPRCGGRWAAGGPHPPPAHLPTLSRHFRWIPPSLAGQTAARRVVVVRAEEAAAAPAPPVKKPDVGPKRGSQASAAGGGGGGRGTVQGWRQQQQQQEPVE